MTRSRFSKALQRKLDIQTLDVLGIDVAGLSEAQIRAGAEAARRMSQCESVPGSCKRRPAAYAAWQEFVRGLAKGCIRPDSAIRP